MKKVLVVVLITLLMVTMFGGCTKKTMTDASKKAILVVSFGTSYADTRELTIEATENRFKQEFADYDVYRAFTSQTIINILKDRDKIEVMNVKEALEALKKDKYSKVVIQPLHVMNGAEYDELVKATNEYVECFDELIVGRALLSSVDDYAGTIKALEGQLPSLNKDEAVVFMGHGTHHHANSVYAAFEYALHDCGFNNVFVGTVEGYPAFEDVLERLEENNIRKVILMPFMLVAGDHASNDMAGDEDDSWKTMLKKAGYEVEIYLHGLGENEGIQNIYIQHAKDAMHGGTHEE